MAVSLCGPSLYYAGDSDGSSAEIVYNVVRRTVAGALGIEPVARSDEECRRSRGQACLNIGAFVSHEERVGQVGPQRPRGSFEKPDLRFAAGTGVIRQMR